MIRLFKIPLMCAFLIPIMGCVDIIQLSPDTGPNTNVVINGKLTYGHPSAILVQVSQFRPTEVFSSASPANVEQVMLIDLDNQETFRIPVDTDRRGFFAHLDPDLPGINPALGKTYKIEVTLRDGRVYESSPQIIYDRPDIQKLTYSLGQRTREDVSGSTFQQDIITFQVQTGLDRPDGSGNAYLLWERDVTFKLSQNPESVDGDICYLSYDLVEKGFPILDGTALLADSGQTIVIDLFESVVDFRYAEGFQFRVRQESTTPEAFEYFEQIRRVLNRSGTVSEDPPGEVLGNMHSVSDPNETVYGLFYTVTQDSASLFISPREVGSPDFYCPLPIPPSGGFGAPTVTLCSDCVEAWGNNGPVSLNPPFDWGG